MLNINGEKKGNGLFIELEGRLDTTTAPQVEEKMNTLLKNHIKRQGILR